MSNYSSEHDQLIAKKDNESQETTVVLPPPPPPPLSPSAHYSHYYHNKIYAFLSDPNTRSAIPFAFRMGILLSISSLFVLISTPNFQNPDGMSVLVTVLFVCWFPTLDTGSILEKIVQRLIGTFIGATVGLLCGFTSLLLCKDSTKQTLFIATCMFIVTFTTIFLAGRIKVGKLKVIKRFAYATILCILTFCICVLPFASNNEPKWKRAIDRVNSVIIGCIIGAIGSFVLCPRSTVAVLYEKTAAQVKLAGEASQAVMYNAANIFGGSKEINRLADEIFDVPLVHQMRWELNRQSSVFSTQSTTTTNTTTTTSPSPPPSSRSSAYSRSPSSSGQHNNYQQQVDEDDVSQFNNNTQDVALDKYEEAIAEWNSCKLLVPLARYGPFGIKKVLDKAGNGNDEAFQLEMARTLARSLRIQTSVVVIDGMVRNEAEYDFEPDHVLLFRETGTLIKAMLTLPLDQTRSKAAATQLFRKVEKLRQSIDSLRLEMPKNNIREQGLKDYEANLTNAQNCSFMHSTRMEDDMGMGLPKYATGGDENTLLFLQLVEHLILRSLRLYQAWDQVERQADQLETAFPAMKWSILRNNR